MKPHLGAKIGRRRLLTSLVGTAALTSVPSLISGAASEAPGAFRFAAPGDAVIVTSKALIEIDPGLPQINELARRLDQAFRTRRILDQISRLPSRQFALGSVTLQGPLSGRFIWDVQTALDDQSQAVPRNFGPLATGNLPIHIATALPDHDAGFDAVLDTISYITCKAGFWRDAKSIHLSDAFSITNAARRTTGAFDLITLWPFNISKMETTGNV
jgi:hypothetical protein